MSSPSGFPSLNLFCVEVNLYVHAQKPVVPCAALHPPPQTEHAIVIGWMQERAQKSWTEAEINPPQTRPGSLVWMSCPAAEIVH